MHAAHPLIAAGARQTSFYQRDPWKRLIRTLSLQNSVTFGTKEEANESALRINKLHEVIKGKDEVSGGIYDALDQEQLLWVHACLQISSIYFYELTVRKLSQEEKNQYHDENIIAAELVLIKKEKSGKHWKVSLVQFVKLCRTSLSGAEFSSFDLFVMTKR